MAGVASDDPLDELEAPVVSAPYCPFCNKPVEKSPQECPQCHVAYHPNCWRQLKYCVTCSLENPERAQRAQHSPKRPIVRAGEAVTFTYDGFIRDLSPYLTIPGSALPPVCLFLFLFRRAAPLYLWLSALGLLLAAMGWLVRRTGGSQVLVSPSTRSLQRRLTLFGCSTSYRLVPFADIRSFRVEGEQRFKGDQKGVSSYYFQAFWVVAVTTDERHVRLSDEIRTDLDPDFVIGEEYEYAGLLPRARKAAAVVGVDAYVAPNITNYQLWPLVLKAALLAIPLALLLLFS